MEQKNALYSINEVFLLLIKNRLVSKIDGEIILDGEILYRLICDMKSLMESSRINEQI